MQIYNLDNKITSKSNSLLNCYIESQKELDTSRINEIRIKCRDILEKNGIFEDRKNGAIYIAMENELRKLEDNISYFNEGNLEEMTRAKIDSSIENISLKIESLEQDTPFNFVESEYTLDRAFNETNIRNMLFSYFERYKANTIELLLKRGYSQNTIDNIEEDILDYVTSKNSDILTEKFTQDGIKNINSLNSSLDELSNKILDEAEIRYNCEISGKVYDELKEKRDSVRQKALKLQDLMYQIKSLDVKAKQITSGKSGI